MGVKSKTQASIQILIVTVAVGKEAKEVQSMAKHTKEATSIITSETMEIVTKETTIISTTEAKEAPAVIKVPAEMEMGMAEIITVSPIKIVLTGVEFLWACKDPPWAT